jgi:hypothetical protein
MTAVARLALVLALAAVLPSASASEASCVGAGPAGPDTTVSLPVLAVELQPDRTTHRLGERASVTVTVSELLPQGRHVRSAIARVDLTVRGRLLRRLGGTTDSFGRVVLRFVIPSGQPTGPVKAVATVRYQVLVDGECHPLLEETGSATAEPLMTLRR